MKRFWLIVLALVILPTCTQTIWTHTFKIQDQYGPDRWDCEQDLAARCQPATKVYSEKSGILGFIASRKKDCQIEDDDVDRCMVLKHGWIKKEVPK